MGILHDFAVMPSWFVYMTISLWAPYMICLHDHQSMGPVHDLSTWSSVCGLHTLSEYMTISLWAPYMIWIQCPWYTPHKNSHKKHSATQRTKVLFEQGMWCPRPICWHVALSYEVLGFTLLCSLPDSRVSRASVSHLGRLGLFVVVLYQSNSIAVILWQCYDVWGEKEKARANTFTDSRNV